MHIGAIKSVLIGKIKTEDYYSIKKYTNPVRNFCKSYGPSLYRFELLRRLNTLNMKNRNSEFPQTMGETMKCIGKHDQNDTNCKLSH